jgi:uncharacterized protein YegP (UPF0339 family)
LTAHGIRDFDGARACAGKGYILCLLSAFIFPIPTSFHANPAIGFQRQKEFQMIYYYFQDDKGEWRWLLKAGNGRPIAASGAPYEDEQECLYDIELVKGSSDSRVKKQ